MIAGIHFPTFFGNDLFTLRRSGTAFASGNPYDPNSLLTGEEVAQGFTYSNSARNWPDEMTYNEAVAGNLTTEEILSLAPRVPLNPQPTVTPKALLHGFLAGLTSGAELRYSHAD